MAARAEAFLRLMREVLGRHTHMLRVTGIAAILLFSFWAGMAPHWDYRYPLHVDEWIALGYAQSTLDAGRLHFSSPYGGGEITQHHEMGFHLLLAFLKTFTGLSWLGLYRIAPGMQVALLAFLVCVFGRRAGFGWAAALFVLLIPTSLRTLGPTFMVPVSSAMILIPVTIILLHRMEAAGRGQSLWLLLVLLGGTLFVHPPTEGVVTGLAVLYLATLAAKALIMRRYRAAGSLLMAVGIRILIPIIVLGVWLPSLSVRIIEQSLPPQVEHALPSEVRQALPAKALERSVSDPPEMIHLLGLNAGFFAAFGGLAVALFPFGIFVFVWHRRHGPLTYVLPAVTGFLLWFLLFLYPRYLVGPGVLYERGWLYLGLFMAVFAGYGVNCYFRSVPAIARGAAAALPRLSQGWIRVFLMSTGIAVVAAALATGVFSKERQYYAGYYHMIDDQMYADFQWLGQHTAERHRVAFAEPSVAWAYPPTGGAGSTAWRGISAPRTEEWAIQLRRVLATGEVDTNWLRQQGVSVLYTCVPGRCVELNNTDLPKVRRGVYVVPPGKASER